MTALSETERIWTAASLTPLPGAIGGPLLLEDIVKVEVARTRVERRSDVLVVEPMEPRTARGRSLRIRPQTGSSSSDACLVGERRDRDEERSRVLAAAEIQGDT